jgi:eukaryotic-like serine/threonine-protein kinase
MLSGRVPFGGNTPGAVSLQHINATPVAPVQLNRGIPKSVSDFIMRLISKKEDQRYTSALDVVQVAGQLLDAQ